MQDAGQRPANDPCLPAAEYDPDVLDAPAGEEGGCFRRLRIVVRSAGLLLIYRVVGRL